MIAFTMNMQAFAVALLAQVLIVVIVVKMLKGE